MKKLTAILTILLITTPVYAGSIQLESYNGDSWVVGTASGNGTFETHADLDNYPDSFAPTNPARSTHAWKYVDGSVVYDTTGTVVKPGPAEAIAQFTDYFIQVEGDTTAGLDRLDTLLNQYPTAESAINREYYDMAKGRIDKADSEGVLTDTEATDLKLILDGTYKEQE